MNETHKCLKEEQWGELNATLRYLREGQERIEKKVCNHIFEGEKHGGYRDRLMQAEQRISQNKEIISALKRGYWKVGLASGFLGALIGHATPNLVALIDLAIKYALFR